MFIGAIVLAISKDEPSVNGESATTHATRLARNQSRNNRRLGRDLMQDFKAVGVVFNTPAANIIAATRLLDVAGATPELLRAREMLQTAVIQVNQYDPMNSISKS